MEETKKLENEQQDTKQPVLQFTITEQLSNVLRKYFGTKPFVEAADIIQLCKSLTLSESEINLIINRLGQYPYDEVVDIFNMFNKHVKQVEPKASNTQTIESEIKE